MTTVTQIRDNDSENIQEDIVVSITNLLQACG